MSSSAGAWAEPQLLSVGLDSVLAVLKLLMGGWKCGRKEDKEESISGGWPREGEEGAVGAWTHSTGEPEHTFDLGLSCLPREAEFTLQAISMHY